jgi:hypothetical protein
LPTYGTGESLLHAVRQRIGSNYASLFEEFVRMRGRGRERMAFCLWHENTDTEALSINVEEGTFLCRNPACGVHGDFITFYMRVRGLRFTEAVAELARRLGIDDAQFPHHREETDTAAARARNNALLANWVPGSLSTVAEPVVTPVDPVIDEAIVEAMHERLLASPAEMAWLNERRGINEQTVRHFKLGHDGQRYYIPIRNEDGQCVNIRRYKANARRASEKMISWREGFGAARLFPVDVVVRVDLNQPVFLLEGEMDLILAVQHNLNAITTTGGAGTWKSEWNERFRDRTVYICYDNDQAGASGAHNIARQLTGIAREVRVVVWPYSEPEGFDLTDYIHGNGQTIEDLIELVRNTPVYRPPPIVLDEAPAGPLEERTLSAAGRAEERNRDFLSPVQISGIESAPTMAPKEYTMHCGSAAGTQPYCETCALRPNGGTNGSKDVVTEFRGNDVLNFVNVKEGEVLRQQKVEAGIPTKCTFVREIRRKSVNVLPAQISPDVGQAEGVTGSDEYVNRVAYQVVGEGLPFIQANQAYRATIRTTNDPKTQKLVHVITGIVPSQSDIDVFRPSAEVIERLRAFQLPDAPTPEYVWAKLAQIQHDLERITRIYERRDLMTAVDLTYCSPLGFIFQGERIVRGWMECLVIGDSRTGKTTVVQRLMHHYRAGEFASGENTSFAGLVGGLNELNRTWFTRWGRVPLNDRRLLTIDEAGNLPHEQIARMSSMRSSGVAEVVKIHTERTRARTRQIWISNPRGNRPLSTYSQGTLAVKELIGAPEDIARFDLVVTASSSDVALSTINAAREAEEPETFTSDLCHQRVMWAWSRRPDQIRFAPDAVETILGLATEMGEKYRYATEVPLVEPNEQRVKLARISAAVAIMFFSTTDGETVQVKAEHARFAREYLDRMYAKPSLAFDEYARMQKRRFQLADQDDDLDTLFETCPRAIRALMEQEQLTQTDIAEIFGMDDRSKVRTTVTMLKEVGFLRRVGSSYYVKTPAAITWLRSELMTNRIATQALQRPIATNGNGNGAHAANGNGTAPVTMAMNDDVLRSRMAAIRTEVIDDTPGEPEW